MKTETTFEWDKREFTSWHVFPFLGLAIHYHTIRYQHETFLILGFRYLM